ncbi:exopolysaccharide biosynthesis protein [Peribacillus deserti]|uniref:Exopolysaccharide biosynthesis protein n=1 Tax=Peribacillus deserti TaxID=673318 RepID=A0ABS2QKP1_9BACI|nr:phosphodiester glycosidase family protein [Peribacillus deserti]MBM7693742.1 exopolysaccharide biosynthesis protein [Peribacillus deserti]
MKQSVHKVLLPVITAFSLAVSGLTSIHVTENKAEAAQHKLKEIDHRPLPLGYSYLNETRHTSTLAKGVTYTKIVRGEPSQNDFFTVDVDFVETEDEANSLSIQLSNVGYHPFVDRISKRAADDKEKGELGFLVRVGKFMTEQEAKDLQQKLTSQGYTGLRVVFSGEDGQMTSGPWVVNVLEVNPKNYKGSMVPELGSDVIPGKEKLTSIASRNHAIAGINGGYFVVGDNDGTPGDLAGISVIGGRLLSEAVNGRSSFIFSSDGSKADIASVSSNHQAVSFDGSIREVDGFNRKPGLIRGCGGTGGDSPTEEPKHDYTCRDSSELIAFTPEFGNKTESGEGVEAVLNKSGKVTQVRTVRGGTIPVDGMVLAGTNEAAQWILDHARLGKKLAVSSKLTADGKPLLLKKTSNLINGGPRLVKDGKISVNAVEEGFHWEENPEFYYRFGERRNPRTLMGIKENGNLIFVTVNGRAPGFSVGANFEESAAIMKSLGAANAMNLDGGGSTGMTTGRELVTRPSDLTGERELADAILLLPR